MDEGRDALFVERRLSVVRLTVDRGIMTDNDEVFGVEDVNVDKEDLKALRHAVNRIGCAVFIVPREQADLVKKMARKAKVKPNRWIVDAMNAYAQKDS